MNLNVQRGVGLAVGILALISGITGLVMGAAQRFAALDTRLGKLESALKVMNATTVDERYKQAIKELMAAKEAKEAEVHTFGRPYPATAGAAADAPAVKVPQ